MTPQHVLVSVLSADAWLRVWISVFDGIREISLWKVRFSPRLEVKVHQEQATSTTLLCPLLRQQLSLSPPGSEQDVCAIAQPLWQKFLLSCALHHASRIWHHKGEQILAKTSTYVRNHCPAHTSNNIKGHKFEWCLFLAAQSICPHTI